MYAYNPAEQNSFAAASSLVPDADDTAKAIMALRYLGETDVSVRPLVETFECRSHFLTYPGERNPSFSTNCNILMCLGMLEDPLPYKSQIIKTARFLCDQVYQAQIIDKWVSNISLVVLPCPCKINPKKMQANSH